MGKMNDKKNDIVLTPDYFCDFLCDLAGVDEKSIVLDNACGTGNILRAALEKGSSAVGIEYDGECYQTAVKNLEEHSDRARIICGDGLKLDDDMVADVNTVIINPPYSFGGSGLVFGIEAAKHVKSGKMIVLCPTAAGSKEDFTKQMLEHNTLVASINCPEIFKGFASVDVSLFVFEIGRAHDYENDEVVFVDFQNDGYKRSGRKTQKGQVADVDNAAGRYKEIVDIVVNGKEAEIFKDFVVRDTLKENKSWSYSSHKVVDTTPTEDDFKKTVADYLNFKCKQMMQSRVKDTEHLYLAAAVAAGYNPLKDNDGLTYDQMIEKLNDWHYGTAIGDKNDVYVKFRGDIYKVNLVSCEYVVNEPEKEKKRYEIKKLPRKVDYFFHVVEEIDWEYMEQYIDDITKKVLDDVRM